MTTVAALPGKQRSSQAHAAVGRRRGPPPLATSPAPALAPVSQAWPLHAASVAIAMADSEACPKSASPARDAKLPTRREPRGPSPMRTPRRRASPTTRKSPSRAHSPLHTPRRDRAQAIVGKEPTPDTPALTSAQPPLPLSSFDLLPAEMQAAARDQSVVAAQTRISSGCPESSGTHRPGCWLVCAAGCDHCAPGSKWPCCCSCIGGAHSEARTYAFRFTGPRAARRACDAKPVQGRRAQVPWRISVQRISSPPGRE